MKIGIMLLFVCCSLGPASGSVGFEPEWQPVPETFLRINLPTHPPQTEKESEWDKIRRENEYLKNKAEEIQTRSLWLILYFFIFALLTFLVLYSIAKVREKKKIIKQQKFKRTLEHIKEGKQRIKRLEEQLRGKEKHIERIENRLSSLSRNIEMKKERQRGGTDVSDVPSSSSYIENFRSSPLSLKIYAGGERLTPEDWQAIYTFMRTAYPDFSRRLIALYPRMSEEDLHVCCLVKMEVPVKRIATIMSLTVSGVSQCRRRLYKKLTGKPGGTQDFDCFIADL